MSVSVLRASGKYFGNAIPDLQDKSVSYLSTNRNGYVITEGSMTGLPIPNGPVNESLSINVLDTRPVPLDVLVVSSNDAVHIPAGTVVPHRITKPIFANVNVIIKSRNLSDRYANIGKITFGLERSDYADYTTKYTSPMIGLPGNTTQTMLLQDDAYIPSDILSITWVPLNSSSSKSLVLPCDILIIFTK